MKNERLCNCPLPCQCNVPTGSKCWQCPECRVDQHMNRTAERVPWSDLAHARRDEEQPEDPLHLLTNVILSQGMGP